MRKKLLHFKMTLILTLISMCATATEKDSTGAKLEFSAGADIVSSYIFRGSRISGVSIQPNIGLSYNGFSLGGWGSTDLRNEMNELDWILSYGKNGFTIGVTDYFGPYNHEQTPKYFGKKSHILEGSIGFDFSELCSKFALTLVLNTNFLNDLNEKGEEQYSTYVEFGYPFSIKDYTVSLALGLTPWEGIYSTDLNVVNISVKGERDVKITDNFSLPIFTQVILNPNSEEVFGVFGITF